MNAQVKQQFRLRLERTIRVKPARVFEARWSAPVGARVADAESDLRVDGR
jgi:uncharacterized protein YndB with AHSA1/START domain